MDFGLTELIKAFPEAYVTRAFQDATVISVLMVIATQLWFFFWRKDGQPAAHTAEALRLSQIRADKLRALALARARNKALQAGLEGLIREAARWEMLRASPTTPTPGMRSPAPLASELHHRSAAAPVASEAPKQEGESAEPAPSPAKPAAFTLPSLPPLPGLVGSR